MRKSFLLSGILLASVLALRCEAKNHDDEDDDAGEGGGSGEGGTAGKGGAAGSATAMGGASGSSAPGSGGDAATGGSSGSTASGGSGDQGGTGGSGESGMGGEPGTGGTTGGSDATGGTTGGSDATGGTTGGSDATGGTGGSMGGMGAAGGSAGKGGTGGTAGKGGTGGTAGKGGTGGTAGKGGGAGAGGAAGAGAGAGGSAGGLSCGPGEGLALTSEPGTAGNTGWIEGDDNCVGIQGAVLVAMDEQGSSITLTETDGKICVSGHAEQVVLEDFTDYWGAFISIQLNNPGTGVAGPYNASTSGVDGFKFSLSGDDIPAEIRPTLMVNGSATLYCKQICDDGAQSILLSQAHADCWEGTAGAIPGATALTYLRFSIPSIEAGDVTFDFCIDGLTAITDNVSVGDPGTCPVTPVGDSCVGRCGTFDTDLYDCQCDMNCGEIGDCCADYSSECGDGG